MYARGQFCLSYIINDEGERVPAGADGSTMAPFTAEMGQIFNLFHDSWHASIEIFLYTFL